MKKKSHFGILSAVFYVHMITLVWAQNWPTQPIRFVVPWPVAGGPDIIARAFASGFQKVITAQVIVENRPGANSITGTRSVMSASPDGYTLLAANTAFGVNPSAYKKLPYDTLKDFSPISLIGKSTGYIVVVNPKSQLKSLTDLVSAAKNSKLFYGSAGIGNGTHLAAALFAHETGIEMGHIPYPGVADAMHAILTGEVNLAFVTTAAGLPKVNSGELKAIGYTGDKLPAGLNDAQLVNQIAKNYQLSGAWVGLFAPTGTSSGIISEINRIASAATKDDDFQSILRASGYETEQGSPEDFSRFVANDIKSWEKAFQAAKLNPQ